MSTPSALHSAGPTSAASRKPGKSTSSRGGVRGGAKHKGKSHHKKEHANVEDDASKQGKAIAEIAVKNPSAEQVVPDAEHSEWVDDLSWDGDFGKVDDLYNRRDPSASSYTETCRTLGITPVQYIAQNWNDRELQLSNMGLGGPKGVEALAAALATNKTISHIDLSQNSLGELSVPLFQQLASNRTLTYLNLSGNSLGSAPRYLPSTQSTPPPATGSGPSPPVYLPQPSPALQSLADYLGYTSTLRVLILQNNSLGDVDALSLAQGLRGNSTLEVLELNRNEIGDVGALALGEGIKASALKKLYLGSNHLRPRSVPPLCQHLSSVPLTHLDLSRNGLTDTGAAAVASWAARNPALVWLDLSEGRIGDAGAAALAKVVGEGKLEEVYLGRNSFNDQGALPLIKAASSNSALKILSVPATSFVMASTHKPFSYQRTQAKSSNPISRLTGRISDAYYYYRVETGIYMLDSWEAAIFNTLVLVVLTLALYATLIYAPSSIDRTRRFLLYLLGGEQSTWINAIPTPVKIALEEAHGIPS
ncbi:RNI-like protein, partial [Gonapodya prolifera JEL478]